jgi:hypothetical protein
MGSANSGAAGGLTQGLWTPRDVDRLAKVAGLLGSDHAGERSAAALRATEILRACGLTWRDVIERALAPAPAPTRAQAANDDRPTDHGDTDPTAVQRRAAWVLRHAPHLTLSALSFLNGLAQCPRPLTAKQAAWLAALEKRARAAQAGWQ